jgi:peptide/nickel transport system permease protein
MNRYIIRRLLLTIPTILGVSILISALIYALPGDAVTMMMQDYQGYASNEDELRAKLGLDKPFHEQYLQWLGGILQGDLGNSLRNKQPIADDIKKFIPVTMELGILGLLISLTISVPLGVYSAVKQDSMSDYVARSLAIGMLAIPGFWLATLSITIPSIWCQWASFLSCTAPPLRYTQLWDDPGKNLAQMWLPALILGIGLSGTVMRLTRAQMLEVLRHDYIRTARAKGLAERLVVFRHALKNALIPVVTLLGLQIAVVIGGAVVLESIFVIPGMGRYLLDAINSRDYPIVQALVLLFGIFIVFSNLIIDLLYAWLDPRIRYS